MEAQKSYPRKAYNATDYKESNLVKAYIAKMKATHGKDKN